MVQNAERLLVRTDKATLHYGRHAIKTASASEAVEMFLAKETNKRKRAESEDDATADEMPPRKMFSGGARRRPDTVTLAAPFNAPDSAPSRWITLATVDVAISLTDELPVAQKPSQSAEPWAVDVYQFSLSKKHNEKDRVNVNIGLRNGTHSLKLEATSFGCPETTIKVLRHLATAVGSCAKNPDAAIFSIQCSLSLPEDPPLTMRATLKLKWRLGATLKTEGGGTFEQGLLRAYCRASPDIGAPWQIQDFYDNVHITDINEPLLSDVQDPRLSVQLFPFQNRAVQWLLRREGVEFTDGQLRLLDAPAYSNENPPPSFYEARALDDKKCFVSQERLCIVEDISEVRPSRGANNGGILAEEMGLGKTVEMLALITLHRRPEGPAEVWDDNVKETVRTCGATLIVTPPSLMAQWKSEIKKHASHLSYYQYNGVKKEKDEALDSLHKYDVVLTTYQVLSNDIHHAKPPPERTLRHAKVHKARRSPLVQLSWWRVCLDEAQMVESATSQPAVVARLIPRVKSWAVTGTPVRRSRYDLRGLLVFLRYEPFASSEKLWNSIDKATFCALVKRIALRHTKQSTRHEVALPSQKRVVITTPFTTIEEQNYTELFKKMCHELELDENGGPLDAAAYLDILEDPRAKAKYLATKREWLVRLRQTCLHPQIGVKNRRALGRGRGPIRTIADVLEAMVEQSETTINSKEYELIFSMLTRGHVHAFTKDKPERKMEALKIYEQALIEADRFVEDCRRKLREEEAKAKRAKVEEDTEEDGRVGAARMALRRALMAAHACNFFIGTTYYQIKMAPELTAPDSDQFKAQEANEVSFYDKAKAIRKELSREVRDAAEKAMQSVSTKTRNIDLTPIDQINAERGIETGKYLEELDDLTDILNAQSACLREWRQKVIDALLLPLVDQDREDVTGEEYEDSTKQQEDLYVYTTALRALIADRAQTLSGQANYRVAEEIRTASRFATEGRGHNPKLLLSLLQKRKSLMAGTDIVFDTPLSLRKVVNDLNQLEENAVGSRAKLEGTIAQQMYAQARRIYDKQTKTVAALEAELDVFHSVMNRRVQFYAQLQQFSDTVRPYKEVEDATFDEAALATQVKEENSIQHTLALARTKHRYLTNVQSTSEKAEEQRTCAICMDPFDVGVLTVCGHTFCKDCLKEWFRVKHNCPSCKKQLGKEDLHDIAIASKVLKAQEEHVNPGSPSNADTPSSGASLYSEMSSTAVDEIQTIPLKGGSYGTKIDSIARHLLWLRETDPGSKAVIFSQFTDFMVLLEEALDSFGITTSKLSKKGGIESFKSDPTIQCFLLDAINSSSGLNLVNATHVFLCEPLINPAIELQAIARVHRIGQTRPTTVYMYLVSGTVEEAIYETSVERRLAHMRAAERETSVGVGENEIEVANSREMQSAPGAGALMQKKGLGEVVEDEDLHGLLFGRHV